MYKDPKELLKHIFDECLFLISITENNLTYQQFIEDEILKRAVVRSLEIIGEATKKIPVDVKLRWVGIKWKYMAGMRDRLVHDYMGVNYIIIWDVLINKIPELKDQIDSLLSIEKKIVFFGYHISMSS